MPQARNSVVELMLVISRSAAATQTQRNRASHLAYMMDPVAWLHASWAKL